MPNKNKMILLIILITPAITFNCDTLEAISLPDGQKVDVETVWGTGQFKGHGSFGEVREVNISGTKMAIKKIILGRKRTSTEFSQFLKLTLHEIEVLKDLSDLKTNYFPSFYGCGSSPKNTYGPMTIFVLQEILSTDLDTKNSEILINNIPAKDRIKLYLQIAEGLSLMHSKNYVHSDLKPENIMSKTSLTSPNPILKIIDFGMTYKTNDLIHGGSPLFNAPEKTNTDRLNKLSHDTWAFGLLVASIEAQKTYLFARIPNSCFTSFFTRTCGESILTNVGNVMNKVFGAKSDFGRIVKKCMGYYPHLRPRMEEVVRDIKVFLEKGGEQLEGVNMETTVNHRNVLKFMPKENEEERERERERIRELNNVLPKNKFEIIVAQLETLRVKQEALDLINFDLKKQNMRFEEFMRYEQMKLEIDNINPKNANEDISLENRRIEEKPSYDFNNRFDDNDERVRKRVDALIGKYSRPNGMQVHDFNNHIGNNKFYVI